MANTATTSTATLGVKFYVNCQESRMVSKSSEKQVKPSAANLVAAHKPSTRTMPARSNERGARKAPSQQRLLQAIFSAVQPASASKDDDQEPGTELFLHRLVTKGIGVHDAISLKDSLRHIDERQFFQTVGVSPRTFQRRASGQVALLDSNASDRVLRLATTLNMAARVVGSRDEAERWLLAPAMALDGNKPIDLLQSTQGTELVKTLLQQLEYGVFV